MAFNSSNFQEAEFSEVAFTPSAATKKREAMLAKEQAPASASKPNYFLRAIGRGVLGALLGAIIFASFVEATGWQVSYLAVLVGYSIGKAMTSRMEDRGGIKYQAAALALTFLAVSFAHSIVVAWDAHKDGITILRLDRIVSYLVTGLLFPVVRFSISPRSGVINVIVILVGMRVAYRMTSDDPKIAGDPFKR